MRRKKQILVDRSVKYTEWEEVPESRYEQQEVIQPVIVSSVEDRRIHTFECNQVAAHEKRVKPLIGGPTWSATIYQPKVDVTVTRTVNTMSDGTVIHGEWEIVEERKYSQKQNQIVGCKEIINFNNKNGYLK